MTGNQIRVPVDPANPGQFFACCGLFELADRLWPGTAAWFHDTDHTFVLQSEPEHAISLNELLREFKKARLRVLSDARGDESPESDDSGDAKADPMELGAPFTLRLDWWADKSLKTWAGSQNARKIFAAMIQAIKDESNDPFADCCVVRPARENTNQSVGGRRPRNKGEKREPFYFDARRGASAKPIDTGFSPDALEMTTAACPAVEALCLIGLQRFRPKPTDAPRVFDYWTWRTPLPLPVASVAACGLLPGVGGTRYRFENAFRTDQKKHKGFMPAARMGDD